MTVWAHFVAWLSKASAKVAGVAAVLIGFIYIQQSARRKAARQAVKEEQQRIRTVSETKRQEIRKQANEIDQDNADVDRDDLRERMRSQATDRDSR